MGKVLLSTEEYEDRNSFHGEDVSRGCVMPQVLVSPAPESSKGLNKEAGEQTVLENLVPLIRKTFNLSRALGVVPQSGP